jgi:hypothetical protein
MRDICSKGFRDVDCPQPLSQTCRAQYLLPLITTDRAKTPSDGIGSARGQNAKYSVRVNVFRFASKLGHYSVQSALRICAKPGRIQGEQISSEMRPISDFPFVANMIEARLKDR